MHLALGFQVVFLAVTLLVVRTQAETYSGTYWVDPASCIGKLIEDDGTNPIVNETFRLAKRAGIRNRSGTADRNMAAVFFRLWKKRQSNTIYNNKIQSECGRNNLWRLVLTWQGIMDGIGATTLSPTREAAELRIYCDNDATSLTKGASARWQLVADREQDPDGQKNSQKTTGQEFYDQVNFIRRTTVTNGCLDRDTLAETCKCVHNCGGLRRLSVARSCLLMS